MTTPLISLAKLATPAGLLAAATNVTDAFNGLGPSSLLIIVLIVGSIVFRLRRKSKSAGNYSAIAIVFSLMMGTAFEVLHYLNSHSQTSWDKKDTFHLAIVGSMMLFGVAFGFWRRHKTTQNLHRLTRQLGFHLTEQPSTFGIFPHLPLVTGRHQGRDLQFFCYRSNDGRNNSSQRWLALFAPTTGDSDFHCEVASNSFGARMQTAPLKRPVVPGDCTADKNSQDDFNTQRETHSGLFSIKFNRGGPRLQIAPCGDTAFDEVFLIKTNNPETALAVLTPEVRSQLLSLDRRPKHLPRLLINRGVFCSMRGDFSSQNSFDRLVENLDLVCDLAEQMEKSRN